MRYPPLIFLKSPITRSWPVWARYGTTVLLVAFAAILQWWLWPTMTGHPLVLFYAVVVASAVLFDHGTGYFAVGLSAIAVAYFFAEPYGSMAVSNPQDRLGLVAFIIIGCLSSALLENMHIALHRVSVSNEQLIRADREKDLLLREFSHRVKNDLTILVSLLRLQARDLEDRVAQAALAATADRISVIARVQDRLRRTDFRGGGRCRRLHRGPLREFAGLFGGLTSDHPDGGSRSLPAGPPACGRPWPHRQ